MVLTNFKQEKHALNQSEIINVTLNCISKTIMVLKNFKFYKSKYAINKY